MEYWTTHAFELVQQFMVSIQTTWNIELLIHSIFSFEQCLYLPSSWCPKRDDVGNTRNDEHGEAHEEGSYDRVQWAKKWDHEREKPQQQADWNSNQHSYEEVRLMYTPIFLPHEIKRHDVDPKSYSLSFQIKAS